MSETIQLLRPSHTSQAIVEERPAADRRLVAAAAMFGTTVEWYDFFIYGTAAALVFNQLFFPSFDPLTGRLASFATFAAGMFARPLGAVVFGHYGDRVGRKKMLTLTLFLMGVPTVAIGLVPTYATLGFWAPVLLVMLRILQGIAVGGEWGGAVLMAVEHAPNGKRSFFGSLPQLGSPAGLILATTVFSVLSYSLPNEDFMSWGWRVPFLLSVVLIVIGIFVRKRIPESPVFSRAINQGKRVKFPGREVISKHFKALLLTAGLKLPDVTVFYLITVFMVSYGVGIGIDRQVILNAVIISACVECFLILGFGVFADRIGQRIVGVFGGLFLAAFAFPMFWLIQTGSTLWVTLALVLGLGIGHGITWSAQASLGPAQFPAEVRYSGVSIALQIAGALAGGLTPIIAAALLAASGSTAMISLYLACMGLISALCVSLMRPVSALEQD